MYKCNQMIIINFYLLIFSIFFAYIKGYSAGTASKFLINPMNLRKIFLDFELFLLKRIIPKSVKEKGKETKKKSNPTAKVKEINKFNDFPQKQYSKEQFELLEKNF